MKKPRIHITDHVLVRYAERVVGLDLDPVRRHVAEQVERGVDLGASGVRKDGHVYKLAGETVVTIVPASKPSIRTGGRCGPKSPEGEDA